MSSGRLVFALCLVFSGYFAYTAAIEALQSHNVARDEATAARRVQELESDRAQLRAIVEYVSSDAYVEQEARRTLGYVRDGEIAIVVVGPEPVRTPEESGDWWKRLFPR